MTMNFEKRSLANSDAYFVSGKPIAWTQWTVTKAVAEGYKANGWVYRAAGIIAKAAASVPWVVYTEDDEPVWEHPISLVLANPNPHYSRHQLFELLALWLELTGNAFVKKVLVNGSTLELWPVSPDRISPIPSKDPAAFIDGYLLKQDGGKEVRDPEYTADTVLHLKFTDPSNPYLGVSPLGAASRAVDLDNEQQDWNGSLMGNRAVVDGVFTFKQQLDAPQIKSLTERIKERFTGKGKARTPMVIGGDAEYTRLGMNPVEVDYLNGRKFNRDEIFSIFGVPPQLAGAMESSTFNNFSESMRIFWEATVLPLLDNLCDSLNQSMRKELQPGYRIGYDTSNVAALKGNESDRVAVAKTLHGLGVPMSLLNSKLELGLTEYPDWDKSVVHAQPTDQRAKLRLRTEVRSVESQVALRDKLAEGQVLDIITAVMEETKVAVFARLEAGEAQPEAAVRELAQRWLGALNEAYLLVAVRFAALVVELRADKDIDAIKAAVQKALNDEAITLTDLSMIEASTVSKIINQVAYGVNAGWSVTQIQQAIIDAGTFSPERALAIARTTAGTAASVGQMEAGRAAGATHKVWLSSNFNVRDAHAARNGEVVPVDGKFSLRIGNSAPRYPLDPQVDAADRVNCRCFMNFEIK